MNTKQRDILSTQGNADDNPRQNSTLTEQQKIEGTPFTLIRYEDKWFTVMGNYRLTEYTSTKEEQLQKLETEKWLLIMHLCIISVEKIFEEQMKFKFNKILDQLNEYIQKNPKTEEPT